MLNLFPSTDIGPFGRRQRHARAHRIPVAITRFGTPRDRDSAVVADTFGAHDVMPLGNGCACCTVRAELQTALRRLLAEREQRHFTRIVIETGEDPGPILRIFATERALGAEFYVEEDPTVATSTHVDGVRSFVPKAPALAPRGTIQLNDVFVDERGIVYTIDRHVGGLYVLEMDF